MTKLVDCASIGLFFIGVLASPGTHAQAPAQPAAADAPKAEGVRNGSEPEESQLVERAKALFREGRYRDALPLLQRAHALSRSSRHLFNLGVIHHKLSECEPARDYFERYLAEDAEGNARQQASWALQELYRHCPHAPSSEAVRAGVLPAHPSSAGAGDAAPIAPASDAAGRKATPETVAGAPGAGALRESPAAGPSDGALIFLGAGAAVGVAALVSVALQHGAQQDIDALHARASREGETWDVHEAERRSASDDAHLYRRLSIVLGLGFTALAGTGAALWLFDRSSDQSIDVSLSTEPSLTYSGRF